MKKAQKPKEKAGDLRLQKGAYREVDRIGYRLLGKLIRKDREKKYGPIKIRYPTQVYTLLRFAIWDINKYELSKYKKLIEKVPEELVPNFGKLVSLRRRGRKSLLVVEEVKDFDGKPSKDLMDTGPVSNERFWSDMKRLEEFFLSKNIPFFNLGATQVMVKQINERDSIPVLIDYKRIGTRTYPAQLWLNFKVMARRRIRRYFAKLRENYQKKP